MQVDLIEVGRRRPIVAVFGALRLMPEIASHLLHGEAPPPPPKRLRLRPPNRKASGPTIRGRSRLCAGHLVAWLLDNLAERDARIAELKARRRRNEWALSLLRAARQCRSSGRM